MSTAAAYLALTKPRLLPLVLFSGLPALLMAAGGWPRPALLAAALGGTALAAGAANALNSYLERERDSLMDRTATRPLPAGRVAPSRALGFGLVLSALGVGVLWRWTGATAAGIAVGAILFYVFVYTLWLKPRTPFGVVLGGVSGAIAPLIADAAVDGSVGAAGGLLFAIIFLWQPPHFYAIALYRRDDYARAGFPTLPERVGDAATRNRLALWVTALVPVSVAPVLLTPLGVGYGVCAVALGGWLLYRALRLRARATAEEARAFFMCSLVYLAGLFGAMIAELVLAAWLRAAV